MPSIQSFTRLCWSYRALLTLIILPILLCPLLVAAGGQVRVNTHMYVVYKSSLLKYFKRVCGYPYRSSPRSLCRSSRLFNPNPAEYNTGFNLHINNTILDIHTYNTILDTHTYQNTESNHSIFYLCFSSTMWGKCRNTLHSQPTKL